MTSDAPARPSGTRPRGRLTRLGCLLPILATVLFLLIFLAWPNERHKDASDLQVVLFFVSLALVPVAALAAVVLSAMPMIRARRERAGAGSTLGWLRPLAAIVIGLACVALTIGVIWAGLSGLAVR